MGDVYIEQIIKKINTKSDAIKQGLIMFGGLLILIIAIIFILTPFAPIALLVAAGAIYFTWILVTSLNVEYEYIYTNGEIDIDKIMAKRKRKRITTVRISSFDEFGEFNLERYRSQKYDITINAAVSLLDSGNYYAVYRNREGKRCIIILTPDEKLLNELKKKYKRKTYGRNL